MPHVDKHSNIKVKKHDGLQSSVTSRKRARESDSDSPSENDEESQSSEGAEGPRMSQWIGDDEDENYDNSDVPEPEAIKQAIMSDLASLSFGALLKARRALAKQAADDSSTSSASMDEDPSEDSEDDEEKDRNGAGSFALQEKPERKPIEKRANKHAPMEMSSKRPVSRKRMVVEKHRDPRFGDAFGEYSADHFRQNYEFLSNARSDELEMVKNDLKKARKLLASSPVHLREDRQAEVERLERTMKRIESAIERSKREAFEREVITKVKHEEKTKRAAGKKEWYLKKGDEKRVKLQARFESMSGKEAKKAIEKKQKKIAQREKKSRPFGLGAGREFAGISQKRRRMGGGENNSDHGGVKGGARKKRKMAGE
ncbi:DUF947-domain-containing protein [Serendipita vermifera]|nr:DUF947-domain-containing protein [Serendipita vermifera]